MESKTKIKIINDLTDKIICEYPVDNLCISDKVIQFSQMEEILLTILRDTLESLELLREERKKYIGQGKDIQSTNP